MKTLITTLIVVALLAPALAFGWGENNIGLYVTEAPTGDDAEATLNTGVPGSWDVYLVLTKAWNWDENQSIANVGGFECTLVLPDDWQIAGVTYPPNVLDLNNANEHFYCSGLWPTSFGTVTLATVTLGTFNPTPGHIYIEPYFVAPSIPGSMAITDADYGFSLVQAEPSSGDYSEPIFGLNMTVVPDEAVSWGDVKSLYR